MRTTLVILLGLATIGMLAATIISCKNLFSYRKGKEKPEKGMIGGMVICALSLIIYLVSDYFFFHVLETSWLCMFPAVFMIIFAIAMLYATDMVRRLCIGMDKVRSQSELYETVKNNFIDNMSHEIRNPMNVIIGMTDILSRRSQDPETVDGLVKIRRSGVKLLDTIGDVMDFTRLETGELELNEAEYSLAELIGDIEAKTVPMLAETQVELIVEADRKLPSVLYGDADRVKQLIQILLSNAVKYTRVGIIILKIQGVIGREYIKLTMSVEDTGCGIEESNLEELLTYRARTSLDNSQNSDGMGLGLPIANMLLKLMNGEIALKSRPGEGSIFEISISQKTVDLTPMGDYKEAATFRGNLSDGFTAPTAKVLIVDDSIVNLFVERQIFAKYGIDVTTAESGQECLNLVTTGSYDIIFLDHMMPGMDGIETLRKLRAHEGEYYKRVPVIALTANVISGARQLFMKAGFQGYISKPVEAIDVEKALLQFLPRDSLVFFDRSFASAVNTGKEEGGIEDKIWFKRLKKYLGDTDIREGLRHSGDDYTSYLNVLRVILADGENVCRKLKTFCEQCDMQNFMIEAHAVKSAMAGIGAGRLSFMAAEHESAAAQGDEQYVMNHAGTLISEYKELLSSIERLVEEDNHALERSMSTEFVAMSEEEFRAKVTALKEALTEFNADDAEAILRELRKSRFDSDITRTIKQIEEQLTLFKYDEAVSILEKELFV